MEKKPHNAGTSGASQPPHSRPRGLKAQSVWTRGVRGSHGPEGAQATVQVLRRVPQEATSVLGQTVTTLPHGSLLTPQRNDFLSDKELDGLLLPVVHVAVQLISVHTSSQLQTLVFCPT